MPKPIELRIRVDDEGVQILKETGRELDDVGRKSKKATTTMGRGFARMRTQLERLKKTVFSLKAGLTGLAVALTVGAFVKLGQALIGPSRQVETMTTSFKVLTGSMDVAKARLAELTNFARTTPFELPQVFSAARILRVFGIDTTDNMRLLGDAASAAQVPIQELAVWFGRLSSGDFGEALMRFRELGVATKKDFEGQGLKFDRNGSLQASASQAMNALGRIVRDKFGGMMDEQSKTMDGMLSNFSDFVFQARLKLGEPLFRVVKGALEQILVQADRLSNSGKLEEWGEKIADAAGNSLVWLGHVVDFFRNDLIPAVAEFWGNITTTSLDSVGQNLGESVAEGFKRGFKDGMQDSLLSVIMASGGAIPAALLGLMGGRMGGGGISGPSPAGPSPANTLGMPTEDDFARGMDKSNMAEDMRKLVDTVRANTGPSAGGDTTAGQSDLISPGFGGSRFRLTGAPQDPFAMGFKPRGAGGIGGDFLGQFGDAMPDNNEALRQTVEENRELYQRMVVDALDSLGAIEQAWIDFRFASLDIVGGWFEDLADTSMTGSERWRAIMDQMKRLALRTIWDLASGWIKARVLQATGEKIVQGALAQTAATSSAAAATETAAATSVTSAKAGEATAKAAAAYGWWPLIGAGLLGAFVALLVGSLAKFEDGGIVGGGSGTRDDVPSLLTRGEGVVNRRGMGVLGADGLSALNSGQSPGGGDTFQINVDARGSDAAAVERVVEERLVPALEDLWDRRRLNVSGSRLRRA